MEEKSLINIEKGNIFKKIKLFFNKIFNKNRKIETTTNNIQPKNNFNMIDELHKENKIIKIQRDYENGKITENELSESDRQELLNLYKKQIVNLEENIATYNKMLNSYKEKIIYKKNLLNNK